jgi:hypothetical protein
MISSEQRQCSVTEKEAGQKRSRTVKSEVAKLL